MSQDILDADFDSFVEQLTENTQLTQRQSEVYTLRRCEYTRTDIQDLLSISEGAVDSHYSTACEKVDARGTRLTRHFYTTQFGDVPLLWENQITVNQPNANEPPAQYTLSTPLSSFLDANVSEFTNPVKVFTVSNMPPKLQFEAEMPPVRHHTFADTSETAIYSVLSDLFTTRRARNLTSSHEELFEKLYDEYGEPVSPVEFAEMIIGDSIQNASRGFYSVIDDTFLIAIGRLVDKYCGESGELQLAEALTDERPITLDEFEDQDWISIVGKIGSGKSYTRDLFLSQIPGLVDTDSDARVLEFAPLDTEESRDGYPLPIDGVYSSLESDKEEFVREFYTEARETMERGEFDKLYVVIDNAHYFTSDAALFEVLLRLAHEVEGVTLITTTQTLEDFEESNFEPYIDNAVWLLHRLSYTDDCDVLTPPSEVQSLKPGTVDEPYSECVLYNQHEPFVMGRVSMEMLEE